MTVNEIFEDQTFQQYLRDGIKRVSDVVYNTNDIKSNAFRTLHKKGLLNEEGLKKEFALSMIDGR